IIISKTHPSLFNTISFLLNIVDDTKREKLVNWLQENELEILFNIDSDRITDEIKKVVFQNYFEKVCIENTFWISHNNSFDAKAIAKFGDSEDNFIFLITFLENPKNHFRVIISALELLSYMTCPNDYVDNIKELFISK